MLLTLRKMGIITSLLDLDLYKLTMMQLVWKLHPDAKVRYAFKNRTKKIKLANIIPIEQIRAGFDSIRRLKFDPEEIEYLRSLGLFSEEFLAYLPTLQLPEPKISKKDNGQYKIIVEGTWLETILWETLILSTVNELYYECTVSSEELPSLYEEGMRRVDEKIELLKKHPEIFFAEFGTRRRFSKMWQEQILQEFIAKIPSQMIGTSNVFLSMKYSLTPIGTFAHEMDMVYSGLLRVNDTDEEILLSHGKMLDDWWEMYGEKLSIALSDTYGSKFFFADFGKERAKKWKGIRQDSGNPFVSGEDAIKFYEGHEVDPREKVIVFSDGLNVKQIIGLFNRFVGRIKTLFGWGTNLTNDLGLLTLSLVMKAVEANGHGTVKLSDNLAKATGKETIKARFVKIFGYEEDFEEECTY